jgi:predicted nucleotidyltransferase
MQCNWDGCPEPIHAQVERLQRLFRSLLAGDRIGVYLHGSLAMGCFNPERSDIDLLVITRRGMTVDEKRHAAETLLAVSSDPRPVEISVMRETDLRPWRHPAPYDFHYGEGAWRERLQRELTNGDWRRWNDERRHDPDLAAHVTVTRVRGICIEGAPIEGALPPVPAADYWDAIEGDFRWIVEHPEEDPVYGVLNACRVLGCAETGQVLSKDEGGVWALAALPVEHRSVVERALAVYRGRLTEGTFDRAELMRLFTYASVQLAAGR